MKTKHLAVILGLLLFSIIIVNAELNKPTLDTIEECKDITNPEYIEVTGKVEYEYTYIHYDNESKPPKEIEMKETRETTGVIDTYYYYHNKTICKETGMKIDDEEIIYTKDFKCLKNINIICCFSCRDGDCNIDDINYAKNRINSNDWTGYCIDTNKGENTIIKNPDFNKLREYD